MNADWWIRLLEAARRAPVEAPAEMPPGFDSRAMFAWRRRSDPEEEYLRWAHLLRGALVCASLILLLSLAVKYPAFSEREISSVAIANSALQLTSSP